jgi:hypothetical protein
MSSFPVSRYEEAITCRAIFTDEKLHFDLKQNHGRDPYTAQYYGFWNNINNVRYLNFPLFYVN